MGRQEFQKFCLLYLVLYLILSYSLRFSRFPSSLPFRTPTRCSFLPLPPFPLGAQPPVFPHLLILLVLKNTCHKYDNNIFHHLLPSSSCCVYIDLHSLQEPCMYIALHPGELNTRLHIYSASLLRDLCSGDINDNANAPATAVSAQSCIDHKG